MRQYSSSNNKSVFKWLNIVEGLLKDIKSLLLSLKTILSPQVFSLAKINTLKSCGLKYKFQYYYNLEEIFTKEYPQGLIGQAIHQYIYAILNKEVKFDLEYITELVMEKVYEKFVDMSDVDKDFYKKNVKVMLQNFYSWYTRNINDIFVVNYDVEVKYKQFKLRTKCDCILKDEHGEYYVIDFATTKNNFSEEMLTYNFDTNYQYFVLDKYFTLRNKKFKLIKFFLLYNNIVEFKKNHNQLKELENTILEVYEKVKNKEFKLHKGPLCGWCGYYDICPGWKLEREGDKNKNILPVAPQVTLFRIARETPQHMGLSYSKMSMYLQCPRKYRLCYIDRVGVKPQGFFSIGSTIHNTLELFYHIKPKKSKEPSVEELLSLYNRCWISAGYRNEQEEKEYFEKGKEWLINYYNKFVVGQYLPAYATEEYFELPIGEKHIMIGYIDRIQQNPDGSFEILDYKTDPKIRTQQEVDKDLQLTIYYWAAKNKGIEIKRLGLIFIRFGEVVYTTRTQQDIEFIDGYVREIADKMWADGEKYIQLKKKYEEKNIKIPQEEIEAILPSKINKYCGGCDYLRGCPKEELIKTEYKDKLLFSVLETGEVVDKEIYQEIAAEEHISETTESTTETKNKK